jgi:hypothetical protein
VLLHATAPSIARSAHARIIELFIYLTLPHSPRQPASGTRPTRRATRKRAVSSAICRCWPGFRCNLRCSCERGDRVLRAQRSRALQYRDRTVRMRLTRLATTAALSRSDGPSLHVAQGHGTHAASQASRVG